MFKPIPLRERFNKYVMKRGFGGCWKWNGCKVYDGYGQIAYEGKRIGAHRASWVLHVGPIPNGVCVLHRCDVPDCVNPAHLFLGTRADNNRDRALKGRSYKSHGARNGNSKLTDSKVLQIISSTGTHREIARKFNVTKTTVGCIKRRQIWTHLGGEPPKPCAQIGENAANVKLQSKQVLEIRRRFANGERNKTAIGREFGVLDTTIHNIVTRKSWTHI